MDNPSLDARILVREGGSFSDADLISGGDSLVQPHLIEKIEQFVLRRAVGEPVSRILGGREFYGRYFAVTKDTLDPRPDTETLIEAALKLRLGPTPKILDLGTGTGCILITLLAEIPGATGVAIDLNVGALEVARSNATRHGVEQRIEFRHGSWLEPLESGESFGLIVSNPPYIPAQEVESLAPDVRNFDPRMALTAGESGLEAYKIILKDLKKYLGCGGRALFEIGCGQGPDLARLVDNSNMSVCDSYVDMAGVLRVIEVGCGEK